MKSFYVNPQDLVASLNGQRSLSKPVGYAYDIHEQKYTVFIATDKDTGQPLYAKNGKGDLRFNLRKSR